MTIGPHFQVDMRISRQTCPRSLPIFRPETGEEAGSPTVNRTAR
jgi:hypothetical protein